MEPAETTEGPAADQPNEVSSKKLHILQGEIALNCLVKCDANSSVGIHFAKTIL